MRLLGAGVVLLVVACMAVLLASDFGFYNPERGVTAAGADDTQEQRERELLRITVSDADRARFGGMPTLARLSTFYGTADSLACSARRTFGSADLAVARRPLRRGQVVTLCLN